MKKTLPLLLILSLVLMAFPVTAFAAETVEDPYEAYLRLGKPKPGVDQVVGGVQVWNDAETLYVQFETDEPYCIVALHLQIANDLSDVPEMRGMTMPGPAINEAYDDCLPVRGPFEFDMSDHGWNDGSYLVITAHADIGEQECTTDCETIAPAPYGAFQVTDSEQGLRIDGSPVLEIRSDPDAVLIWDDEQLPDAFFSLGMGGWIEVEFDKPMANREGDDVLIFEDTWGEVYPLEAAEVYASNDGINWIFLGVADNEIRDPLHPWQTISSFDLGALTEARYIRVVDVTPAETMPVDGDGYDLNSIQALQDYVECTETCDTCVIGRAWAGNKIGCGAIWSRWFRYLVTICGDMDIETLPTLDTSDETVIPAPDTGNGVDVPGASDGAAHQQAQKGR